MRYLRLIFAAVLFLTIVPAIILGGLYIYRNVERKTLDDTERQKAAGSFVTLKQGVTHYQLTGPDTGQVIILLHGFSVPYYIWDSTFNYLSKKGYRVLRYDQYGRGFSDRPSIVYNNQVYYDQLNQLITALKIKTPVTLVGVSFGGRLATDFTAAYPTLVKKVILVDPSYEKMKPEEPELMTIYYETTHPNERASSQLADFKYPENYPEWVGKYRAEMQYKGFRHALISTMFNYTGSGRQINTRLNEQHKPVLLIWGRDDKTVPFTYSDSVRSVLKTEFFPVDDAGHLPIIEQATKVNTRMLEFLREQ